jgi:hypothetical protein
MGAEGLARPADVRREVAAHAGAMAVASTAMVLSDMTSPALSPLIWSHINYGRFRLEMVTRLDLARLT